MDRMDQREPSGRRRLSRSREQRLIFGVAGGLAAYFDVDPALVRIGFVLAALFPPLSPLSLIGYVLLAVILPEADADELPGRDQFRRNVESLRSDVGQLTESVRSNLESIGVAPRRERTTVDMADVEVTDVTVPATPAAPAAPAASTVPIRPATTETPAPSSASTTPGASGLSGSSGMGSSGTSTPPGSSSPARPSSTP